MNGKTAYANTGNSVQKLYYLEQEGVGEGLKATFFSADADELSTA